MVNISYLEVPMENMGVNAKTSKIDLDRWNNSKLKDNMWITAQPLYKNINIEFNKLPNIFVSDYRQISPFEYKGGMKNKEKWKNPKQNLLILDIDDSLSIEEAKSIFKPYKYFLYTTKSHQKEKKGVVCDRFRVILRAVNIPMGDRYFNAMRQLEKQYNFIDVQVNNKTGAFLGNASCEWIFNDGIPFDLKPFDNNIETKVEKKYTPQRNVNRSNTQSYSNRELIDVESIKSRLDREIVADIITSYGYVVNRNFKFKIREDEKTPSASIADDGLIKDFGGEFTGDVIDFIIYTQKEDFKSACEIVAEFVGVKI